MAEVVKDEGFLDEVAGQGFEGMEQGDVTTPRLLVSQQLSDVVQAGTVPVGHFYNSLTCEDYGDKVQLVVCHFQKVWVEWKKNMGGYVGTYPVGGLEGVTGDNFKGMEHTDADGNVKDLDKATLDKKIDETKEEIIEVIKDIDGAVTNLSEKVLNLDVSIGEDFVTNIGVGGIPAGTSIENTDQLKRILKNMLLQLKYAEVVKHPGCTIEPTSYVEEVGTTITPTFNLKFNDGSFKSYSNNGNTSKNINAGCKKVANSETYEIKNGTTWKSYTNGSEIKVKSSTINVRGTCSYSGSTATPYNSDGSTTTQNGNPTLAFSGGSCTSGNCTITGKFGIFFKAIPTAPSSVTRETFGSPVNWIEKKTFTFSFNDKVVYLAIPKSYTLESAISTGNEGQVWEESEIKLADAGGDMHDYKLYTFNYSAEGGLGLEVNCKIV